MGVGPSTKETSLHHFRDPLIKLLGEDPGIDLMGVLVFGSPEGNEEKISRTINDINQSKFLYDPPPRATEIKTKIINWDLIKLKSFCTAKETLSKVKRQPSEWEKNNSK